MKIGMMVREAREAAGLTQKGLAERARTAQSAISRIEMDRISPTVNTLERIVAITGAQLDIRVLVARTAVHVVSRETVSALSEGDEAELASIPPPMRVSPLPEKYR